jgi:hypothetical protein
MEVTEIDAPIEAKHFGNIRYYPQERHEQDLVADDDFYQMVMKEFGYRILRGSAVGWKDGTVYERRFRNYLKDKDIKHAVEIGTWRGVSTAILAHYADKVSTFDLKYYDIAPHVWIWAGIQPKIKYYVADSNVAKQQWIDSLDFDFAFIDGGHHYEDVRLDFALVKKCGRVLFHDYTKECPGIIKFVDEIKEGKVERNDPFAYWEAG